MFLRQHTRSKDGKHHAYWPLVETVRTPGGPRQRTVCYLGELNHSAQSRWLKAIEVFNEQGERRQLKLFPSGAEFDVLLYDLTSSYVESQAEKNPMMQRGYSRDHRPDW